MPRLTHFLLRHKLAVVAAWLVVLVAGGAAAGVVPGRLSQEFAFPGQEGYEANVAILEAYGNGGPGNPLVPVVTLPEGTTADSPGTRDALARAFAGIATAHADVADSMVARPELVGGMARDVTRWMQAVPGLVAKDGADGVMAGALPDGSAFALKVAGGSDGARQAATGEALRVLGVDVDGALGDTLAATRPIVSGHGLEV
ncbi:MAG: asparaginase, partial [Actinomycetes bacterium]